MELDNEIFAVGKWNGYTFTLDDLTAIADAFSKLGSNMQVALKMGHNDEQKMTDGQPALGWVDRVWVAGNKLMAHYTDMPKIVYEAMQKKLYKNVSIELDIDVEHKGTKYPFVLTSVALLGADIPAVNTLSDLTHYMGKGAAFSIGGRMQFSAIAGGNEGDSMDLTEALKKIADLTAANAALAGEHATMKAELVTAQQGIAAFTAKETATLLASKVAATTAKRAEVTALFESGVKAGSITPAQREQFTKVLRLADDAALDALSMDDVKALIPATASKAFSKATICAGSGDAAELSIDQQVANEVQAILFKKEAPNFFAAQTLLFARNPQLARAYANCNDTKE